MSLTWFLWHLEVEDERILKYKVQLLCESVIWPIDVLLSRSPIVACFSMIYVSHWALSALFQHGDECMLNLK